MAHSFQLRARWFRYFDVSSVTRKNKAYTLPAHTMSRTSSWQTYGKLYPWYLKCKEEEQKLNRFCRSERSAPKEVADRSKQRQ
ncbi:hypothetical protein SprV_0301136700 [Sparganum proliferum]